MVGPVEFIIPPSDQLVCFGNYPSLCDLSCHSRDLRAAAGGLNGDSCDLRAAAGELGVLASDLSAAAGDLIGDSGGLGRDS